MDSARVSDRDPKAADSVGLVLLAFALLVVIILAIVKHRVRRSKFLPRVPHPSAPVALDASSVGQPCFNSSNCGSGSFCCGKKSTGPGICANCPSKLVGKCLNTASTVCGNVDGVEVDDQTMCEKIVDTAMDTVGITASCDGVSIGMITADVIQCGKSLLEADPELVEEAAPACTLIVGAEVVECALTGTVLSKESLVDQIC